MIDLSRIKALYLEPNTGILFGAADREVFSRPIDPECLEVDPRYDPWPDDWVVVRDAGGGHPADRTRGEVELVEFWLACQARLPERGAVVGAAEETDARIIAGRLNKLRARLDRVRRRAEIRARTRRRA